MGLRLKKLKDQVMVITGASSGIGLCTARMAAKRGARLVLAARNAEALQALADEIRSQGGDAIAVAADVGNEAAVHGITRAAIDRFGRFDTWVNDAGIGMYGKLLDISLQDARRLFDTNLWGVVYGSLEAARHFRLRKSPYAGAIINLGSEVSERAMILLGMYSASKHAVKGFTDALRMELELDKIPASVTLVKPAAIDTPFPEHAKNYMEVEPTLPDPVYAPDVVARTILHCAETPVRDIFAGGSAKMDAVQGALAPRLTDRLMEMFYVNKQKSSELPNPRDDALWQPTTGLHERGHRPRRAREASVYTQTALHPLLAGALLLGGGFAIAALLSGSKSASLPRQRGEESRGRQGKTRRGAPT